MRFVNQPGIGLLEHTSPVRLYREAPRDQSSDRGGDSSLPAHEGHGRREAPGRERRGWVPGPQTLRSAPVGGDEQGVPLPEELAHGLGGGVDEWSG